MKDIPMKRIIRFALAVCLFAVLGYTLFPVLPIPEGVVFYNPSLIDILYDKINGKI